MKVFISGKLYDEKEASISVFDHGLLYGDGVFEGIRIYDGKIFKLEEHTERLFESAKILDLDIPFEKEKINEFIEKIDIATYEFENIPFETLNEINKTKPVLPKPSINKLIQHRLAEKDFVNKLNIRTTQYASVDKKSDLDSLKDLLPGILKTTTMGYDGKGQYPIKEIKEVDTLNIDFSKGYILEKLVKLKKEISVIITRFGNNDYEIYEPIENIHEDQI